MHPRVAVLCLAVALAVGIGGIVKGNIIAILAGVGLLILSVVLLTVRVSLGSIPGSGETAPGLFDGGDAGDGDGN